MSFDVEGVRLHLTQFALEPLFVEELGWDRYAGRLDVVLNEGVFQLKGIAQKRGMVVFTTTVSELPALLTRRKIEQHVARRVHEHLIVFLVGFVFCVDDYVVVSRGGGAGVIGKKWGCGPFPLLATRAVRACAAVVGCASMRLAWWRPESRQWNCRDGGPGGGV